MYIRFFYSVFRLTAVKNRITEKPNFRKTPTENRTELWNMVNRTEFFSVFRFGFRLTEPFAHPYSQHQPWRLASYTGQLFKTTKPAINIGTNISSPAFAFLHICTTPLENETKFKIAVVVMTGKNNGDASPNSNIPCS